MDKIICNPLDLEYRYQYRTSPMGGASLSREAADPTVVLFKETYYLFASMSGGFWYSDDLYEWKFKETPELPIYDYAPDVREVAGRVIFSASRHGSPCSLYESCDPVNEPFVPLTELFEFWDPDIFEDEDGRVYFYWGCTNTDPLWGIEIDRESMLPIGEKKAMFGENEAEHGWERKGENNKLSEPKTEYERMIRQYVGTKPFIEGAYMTKYKGKYYLQYAAPGTECNVYADGVYVGDAPLGPFSYQPHNPFSSKPGGFITSAGHGSTFRDKDGNWWHVSTMHISENESYERRIGLFPCDFDEDGILHCNQNFSDYPFALPEGESTLMDTAAPAMQLLSYQAKAGASSDQDGFAAEKAVDENIRSWWAASEDDPDPWYEIDLGEKQSVEAIQINMADHKMPDTQIPANNQVFTRAGGRFIYTKPQWTAYLLEGSADGIKWEVLLDTQDENSDRAHYLWTTEKPVELRFVRISRFVIPFGGVPAISGLRIFGTSNSPAPAGVKTINASRSDDGINILLSWDAIADADGYQVRYGIAPDKMYNSWQVIGQNELDLSTINKNQCYYIAVDSYNAGGVTAGAVIMVE